MSLHSLIPNILKKTLEPFRNLERSFSNLWIETPNSPETPSISYVEDGVLLPDICIFENDNEFHITASMPGLEEKDIHIEFDKRLLTLRGAREAEKKENRSHYHITEHSRLYFNHTVQLPEGINEDNVEATMKDGVIDITFPKLKAPSARKKPKKRHIKK